MEKSISISKIITVITNNSVVESFKIGSLNSIISGLDSFILTGQCAKPNTINKYQKIAVDAGFKLDKTVWFSNCGFEGKDSDVVNYKFIYKKFK